MKFSIVLLFLILVNISCESDTSGGPVQTDAIVPLDIGYTWKYKDTKFESTGEVSRMDQFERKITDTVTIDGLMLYKLGNFTFVQNRADGFYKGFNHTLSMVLVAKYPASVGERFGRDTIRLASLPNPDLDSAVGEAVVISTGTSVTVPAGTFTAYQYEIVYFLESTGQKLFKEVRYYTPQIGEIKTERYEYKSDGSTWVSSRLELLEYTFPLS